MFKSLFFALGIFLLIFGAQTLFVDKWIMSYERPAQSGQAGGVFRNPYQSASFAYGRNSRQNAYYNQSVNRATVKPVYQTKEWMPWSLLAAGTIIVLYSVSTRHSGPGE